MIAPISDSDFRTATMNEEEIFSKALEFDSDEERSQFLDDACQNLPESRENIEQLLRSHCSAGDFLLTPPVKLLETALTQHGTGDTSGRSVGCNDADDAPPKLDFLAPSVREGSLGRLGVYEIDELIAHGGTGIVFRAIDTKLNRTVALKALKPFCLQWSNARVNFLREARAAAAVRSDHVVTVFAVEDEHAVPFLVMEFIEGESLQQKLDHEGPLSIAEIIEVGGQIAAGLAVAHSQDLIHRDIKPANILIERETGRVQITDFGLARAVKESGEMPLGLMSGTPQYMSPEQAEGKPIDHRSDLFSLGSVLYALITGSPPFRSSNSLAVLRRVVEQEPQALREVRSDLPLEFAELVEKLLEKSPANRPQSADEVAEQLRELAGHTRDGAPEPADQSVVAAAQLSTKPESTTAPTHHDRNGRWRKLAIFLIVAAVSSAAIVLIVKSRDGQSTEVTFPDGSAVAVDRRGHVAVDLGNVAKRDARAETSDAEVTTTAVPASKKSDNDSAVPKAAVPVDPSDRKIAAPPPADLPFYGSQAKKHQTAWAKHLNVPVELSTEIGLTFSLIPPGEFDMGSTQVEVDALLATPTNDGWVRNQLKEHAVNETPRHRVRLTQPFYMSQTEVTVQQFRQFVEETGYETQAESTGIGGSTYSQGLTRSNKPDLNWQNPGYKQTDKHPVVQLTWQDAVAFCEWYSKASGMTVTLPTEAQWEFACRAGSTQRMFFGSPSKLLQEYIVRASPYGAKPVATRLPNPFGLFDVYSNVWEWCSDNFEPNYKVTASSAEQPLLDPQGPPHGKVHVIRSGSYRTPQQLLGSTCRRLPSMRDLSHDDVGFRVAITGDLSKAGKHQTSAE